ncbi:hypothetical protein EDB86DRAFT_2951972 [Lactarius hatsudake]|nr:hypothetical protein EDB86DRAFT_2951972 [Lactarius hatsudake]
MHLTHKIINYGSRCRMQLSSLPHIPYGPSARTTNLRCSFCTSCKYMQYIEAGGSWCSSRRAPSSELRSPAHAHSLVPYSPSSTLVVTVVLVRVVEQTLVVSRGNHPSPGLYPSGLIVDTTVFVLLPCKTVSVGRGVRLLETMMRNATPY